MNKTKKNEIIDLTSSFTLSDHCALSNIIIELDSDESFESSIKVKNRKRKISKACTLTDGDIDKTLRDSSKKRKENTSINRIGSCPICWDELGKNPLASTKCGHVYCLKCLEQSLKVEKKCPTCRQSLKGKAAYHPLYISQE